MAFGAVETGINFYKLCDTTTGAQVGYVTVIRNIPTQTSRKVFFDLSFNQLAAQPANSDVCGISQDFEILEYCFIVNDGAAVNNASTGDVVKFVTIFHSGNPNNIVYQAILNQDTLGAAVYEHIPPAAPTGAFPDIVNDLEPCESPQDFVVDCFVATQNQEVTAGQAPDYVRGDIIKSTYIGAVDTQFALVWRNVTTGATIYTSVPTPSGTIPALQDLAPCEGYCEPCTQCPGNPTGVPFGLDPGRPDETYVYGSGPYTTTVTGSGTTNHTLTLDWSGAGTPIGQEAIDILTEVLNDPDCVARVRVNSVTNGAIIGGPFGGNLVSITATSIDIDSVDHTIGLAECATEWGALLALASDFSIAAGNILIERYCIKRSCKAECNPLDNEIVESRFVAIADDTVSGNNNFSAGDILYQSIIVDTSGGSGIAERWINQTTSNSPFYVFENGAVTTGTVADRPVSGDYVSAAHDFGEIAKRCWIAIADGTGPQAGFYSVGDVIESLELGAFESPNVPLSYRTWWNRTTNNIFFQQFFNNPATGGVPDLADLAPCEEVWSEREETCYQVGSGFVQEGFRFIVKNKVSGDRLISPDRIEDHDGNEIAGASIVPCRCGCIPDTCVWVRSPDTADIATLVADAAFPLDFTLTITIDGQTATGNVSIPFNGAFTTLCQYYQPLYDLFSTLTNGQVQATCQQGHPNAYNPAEEGSFIVQFPSGCDVDFTLVRDAANLPPEDIVFDYDSISQLMTWDWYNQAGGPGSPTGYAFVNCYTGAAIPRATPTSITQLQ